MHAEARARSPLSNKFGFTTLSVDLCSLWIRDDDSVVCNWDTKVVSLGYGIMPRARVWQGKKNRLDAERTDEPWYGRIERKENVSAGKKTRTTADNQNAESPKLEITRPTRSVSASWTWYL
ncbi:hypothetical protein PAXRUDRAFT_29294 [Paxillus rubicundulus Ve08.2h10]|uniref:Uncharacterized protein n=1 Tax=Paxillus rubicundulus Ve08.2h10 TaxID=930991 RepID=A0A0D0CB06_9AGAM|nr:hypothetical protein PAXRUDRAFT_29294 [Paxillus rubicundulus Ve08.2h10]